MFQALRKAVSGNYAKDPRNSLVQDEYRKKKLKENLALHIKRLQKAHIHGSQVIERNDADAANICQALESIFLHEYQIQANTIPANINLRMMFSEGIGREDEMISMAFWGLLKEVTHSDVVTELKHLVVTTEVGLCRAWIRLAINDCLIVSYLDAILSNKSLLRQFYGVNAFFLDSELPFIMKELLQGLIQFEFRLNYNSSKLNTWEKRTLQLAGILEYIEHKESSYVSDNYNQNNQKSLGRRDHSSPNISAVQEITPSSNNIVKRNATRNEVYSDDKGTRFNSMCDSDMKGSSEIIVTRKNNSKKMKIGENKEILTSCQSNENTNDSKAIIEKEYVKEPVDTEIKGVISFKPDDTHKVPISSRPDSNKIISIDGSIGTFEREDLKENHFPSMEDTSGILSLPVYAKEDACYNHFSNLKEEVFNISSTPNDNLKVMSLEKDSNEVSQKKISDDVSLLLAQSEEENKQSTESTYEKSVVDLNRPPVESSEIDAVNDNTETLDNISVDNRMEDCSLAGNRLNGTGWSGWSSAFDNQEDDCYIYDSDSPVSDFNELNESFGSLLQIYGTNQSPKDSIPSEYIKNEFREGLSKEIRNNVIDEESHSTHIDNFVSTPHSDAQLAGMNFEVVPMSAPLQGRHVDKKTLSSLSQLTELALEQGLDLQNFCCKHCGVLIGLIYGPYRVCSYDGGYYCYDCHNEDEHILPARVIQDWDFRRYKVSKYNKLFLMKIEEEPLFHMDEINSLLYDVVPDLKELKYLRIQLQHIKEYVQTCRQEIAEEFRRRLWPREYLCDDIHQYSLLDLLQVYNGQLAHHLKKVITEFSKHIYKCVLCCQKGFICEFCHDETIIYPFQMKIAIQCQTCLTTFHKSCRQEKRCPKCVRIRLRSQSKGTKENEIDRLLSVTQKERYTNNDIL